MAAQKWWIVTRSGEQGPISATRLQSLAQEGRISATTRLRQDGTQRVILATRLTGLLPKTALARTKVLLEQPGGRQAVRVSQLEQMLDADEIPFNRQVVSLDEGESWLRPAEALQSLNSGEVLEGMRDPSTFNAFAGVDVKIGKAQGSTVGAADQHRFLKPWTSLASLLVVIFFVPLWIDAEHSLWTWSISSALPEAPGLTRSLVLLLLIGLALLPILRFSTGALRAGLVLGLGGVGFLTLFIQGMVVDHGLSEWCTGPVVTALFLHQLAVMVMLAGNYVRAYFPAQPVPTQVAGIGAGVALASGLYALWHLLNRGLCGFTIDTLRTWPFVMWVSALVVGGVIGIACLCAVLILANSASRGEAAVGRANLAHIFGSRIVLILPVWLGILPIVYFAPGVLEVKGPAYGTFFWSWLASLRGVVYIGGSLFLIYSASLDLLRLRMVVRDESLRRRAVELAQRGGA